MEYVDIKVTSAENFDTLLNNWIMQLMPHEKQHQQLSKFDDSRKKTADEMEALKVGQVIFFVAVISSFVEESQAIGDSTPNVTEILDSFLIGYDKRLRPNYGDEPLTINISMYILDIPQVLSTGKDFTMTFYFRQFWTDKRLVFPSQSKDSLNKISLGTDFSQEIWLPDSFFVNEISGRHHNVPHKNDFLRIMSEGEILRSIRITVTSKCTADMTNFPFDVQTCLLEIESYGFSMADIRYAWKEARLSPHLQVEDFKILGHKTRLVEAKLATANYSRLTLPLYFSRESSYYTVVYLIPTKMFVCLAFLALMINADKLGPRLGLALTSLFGVVGISNISLLQLHKVPYTKLMDIFMGISCTTCFLVVVECVLLAGLGSKSRIGRFIDYVCRFFVPGLYTIFLIVFWIYALAVKAASEDIDEIIPFLGKV